MSQVFFAETEEDIRLCFPAMYVLRPHLTGRGFVEQVRRQQQQGYHLVMLREQEQVKCVAGFRLLEFLAWGKVLYIDDLVTEPGEKRQGYGGRMIDWLISYAQEHACNQVHLDSGYQRHDAHRFYLGKGFTLSSHHFTLKLWY